MDQGHTESPMGPIEYFVRPDLVNPPPKTASESGEKPPKARKEESESEE